jgi:hypothetical protein
LYHLSHFRSFENQLLNQVNGLVTYCKDHCIKNIIIGGKVSDPGKLGYLTCKRIQIYPPPSAIQDTMVAINSHRRDFSVDPSPSDTATCRYIATVKALTKMKDQEEMKRGVHITGIITREETHYHSKCVHLVTTLVNEKIMGYDCPILDISDSKMGRVGLAILVDMKTPMEGNRIKKLARKNMKYWGQPSIYAWPIVHSGLKIIDGTGLLILNDLAKSVYNFITTVQSEGNGTGSANRS